MQLFLQIFEQVVENTIIFADRDFFHYFILYHKFKLQEINFATANDFNYLQRTFFFWTRNLSHFFQPLVVHFFRRPNQGYFYQTHLLTRCVLSVIFSTLSLHNIESIIAQEKIIPGSGIAGEALMSIRISDHIRGTLISSPFLYFNFQLSQRCYKT